tara:strand:+ start:3044 stop:3436 length:393 start_codon:yes stop_codon:yes gene_type:complete
LSKITIELVGAEDLAKILASAGAKAVPALKQALTEEAQIVFRDSQRLVPVDTGTLRRSGIIIPVRERGNLIEVAMGYGGAASSYALRQHENLQYRHKKGQQAKYLETPLFSRANKLLGNIKRRMERILSK